MKILLLILRKLIPEQFFFHLSNLSKSKATGLDGISARLLRECPDLISESLTLIFNRSINTGIFPDEWKYAKVIPIHKHGKRNCTDNYRPISIIPVVRQTKTIWSSWDCWKLVSILFKQSKTEMLCQRASFL